MKHFIIYIILFLFFMPSLTSAEEPILVIDSHGHSSRISEILFTPDGKTLISLSEDKSIRLWDVQTGDLKRTLRQQIGEGRDGAILSGAISPDGKTLAIGGIAHWDDQGLPVYLFNLENGEVIGVLRGHQDTVNGLEFSRDGKWLASSSGPEIRIWNASTWETKPVLIFESPDIVFDIAFAADAKKLVSGHVDRMVRLWALPKNLENIATSGSPKLNKPQKVMKKHTNVACCVDYSSNGKYIVSGDFDGHGFLWDSKKGKLKRKFKVMDTVSAVAFSPDGKKVLFGGGSHAFAYSVPKGKKITIFKKHAGAVETTAFSNAITAIAFHGNDLVATAGGNGYDIYIWDLKTGAVKTHIVGQGKRFEAAAFGEELLLAFGHTPGGIKNIGALEHSFDFSEMLLNSKLPPKTKFSRANMKHQGKTLKYEFGNWYELNVAGGGTIKNEPKDGWVRSYTFTPDGDVVVGSSSALKLHRTDGAPIREFIGHTGEVWDVSISRDGRILASASDDQTVRLWNLHTGENLVTLFIAQDREWVCWTPRGYYTASAGGEKYIGWQINQGMDTAAKYYPVSVFRKQLHHPELVKRTIALGSFEQAFAEFKMKDTQILPPNVRWISPEAPRIETTQPSLRIQAEIQSESELTALKVLVNGRAGRGLAMGGGQPQALDNAINQEVALIPGENRISIFAANKEAGVTSDERIVIYQTDKQEKPNLYMVSVGISKYSLRQLELEYADNDAKAISRLFRSQEGKLYDKVIIKELYDNAATQANILQAIEWLKNEAAPKDVVVLFIAAHGTNEQGKYYLLPTDGVPENLEQTGVHWRDFSEKLGNLSSRVLLFIDTCHSGQLGQDVYTLRKQVDNTEAIRKLSSDEYGVVIFAASTGREFSLEHPDWGHGAFTKALIEGMEQGQADYSNDGIIHLRELDLYIAERVEALTSGEQHPTTQKPSTISRFPIVQVK